MSRPKGSTEAICRAFLHAMTPDNVWTRPSDGARYCRACMQVHREARKTLRRMARARRRAEKLRVKQARFHDATRTAVEY